MNDQAQEDRISFLKFHILCGLLFYGVFIGAEESHRSRHFSNTSAETSGKQTTEKQGNLFVSLRSCLLLSTFWLPESSSLTRFYLVVTRMLGGKTQNLV